MNTFVLIMGEVWAMDKDTEKKASKLFRDVLPVDVLMGDGNAEVHRNVYLRLSGGDYNAVVMGTSAQVSIKCNQDDETIVRALGTCEKFAEEAIKRYHPRMVDVANKIIEGMEK